MCIYIYTRTCLHTCECVYIYMYIYLLLNLDQMFLSQDCSGLEMFVRQWLSQSDPVRPLRQVHQHCCLVLARVCTTSDGRAAAKIAATNCGLWTITKLVSEWVQKKSAVFLKGFSVVMWQRSGIGVFFRGVACTRICRFTENGSTGFGLLITSIHSVVPS